METSYLGNGGRTMATKHPASRRYPPEVKQRAVQLVLATIEQQGERHGVVSRIARQLDVGPQTLSHWVHQAEQRDHSRPAHRRPWWDTDLYQVIGSSTRSRWKWGV